jgi:hypothetical protein
LRGSAFAKRAQRAYVPARFYPLARTLALNYFEGEGLNRKDAKYAKEKGKKRNWNVDLLIKINMVKY